VMDGPSLAFDRETVEPTSTNKSVSPPLIEQFLNLACISPLINKHNVPGYSGLMTTTYLRS
jgi:hypothetical protein